MDQQLVKAYFDYNADLGRLVWKKNTAISHKIGKIAGCVADNGYRYIGFMRKRHLEHRLIWLWHNGDLPKELDHIDNDRTNNKIQNLRSVNRTENNLNCGISKNNTSGANGVCWHKQTSKWRAYVTIGYRQKSLGLYQSLDDAIQARKNADLLLGIKHG